MGFRLHFIVSTASGTVATSPATKCIRAAMLVGTKKATTTGFRLHFIVSTASSVATSPATTLIRTREAAAQGDRRVGDGGGRGVRDEDGRLVAEGAGGAGREEEAAEIHGGREVGGRASSTETRDDFGRRRRR